MCNQPLSLAVPIMHEHTGHRGESVMSIFVTQEKMHEVLSLSRKNACLPVDDISSVPEPAAAADDTVTV